MIDETEYEVWDTLFEGKDIVFIKSYLDDLIKCSEGKKGVIIQGDFIKVLGGMRDIIITFDTIMTFLSRNGIRRI
tara:strand:+ start:288 stop:512 length:225 start_codon:yes stop_codon:yes gene_type:complete